MNSFDSFGGSQKGTEQEEYIDKVRILARDGHFEDGDVIDMDFGIGNKNYIYYQGKFYPTSKTANYKSSGWKGKDMHDIAVLYDKYYGIKESDKVVREKAGD